MNFDFSEEQKLLQRTARDFLAEHAPLSVCRKVLESKASYSEDLWKGVAEMGWLGAAVPERFGGAGFGRLELALLAEEVGRALAPIPFSSSVYLATEALLLAGTDAQRERHLPRLASGERIGTFALGERPGRVEPAALETRFENGRLSGTKLPVPDGDVAGLAVVAAREGVGVSLVLVDLESEGVERTALHPLDPSRSLARLVFSGAPAERLGPASEGLSLVERLLDRAAVLMAFEQLGGAQRAFEITREFTLGRYAFGRPVASFQAVKHRLADLYVAIELARSSAYYGAWALEHEAPELPAAACGARVSATDAFELAGREMIQLHGGVGFTWEYDCHLFYRRAKHLALALGGPSEWREKLIRRLEA
jgi:alkylation response protein AidB-like acyl-CoA dehydrogenase